MRRAIEVVPKGAWPLRRRVGVATLDFDNRHRRRIALATDDGAPFLPPRGSRGVILAALGALVAFMALLRPIGFDLAMLALLLALFFAIDRTHPVAKLAIAVVASFGVHWAFETLLSVPLPNAGIPFLRQLGL